MADACDSAAVTGGDVAPPTSSLFQCKHAINPHMRRIITAISRLPSIGPVTELKLIQHY